MPTPEERLAAEIQAFRAAWEPMCVLHPLVRDALTAVLDKLKDYDADKARLILRIMMRKSGEAGEALTQLGFDLLRENKGDVRPEEN